VSVTFAAAGLGDGNSLELAAMLRIAGAAGTTWQSASAAIALALISEKLRVQSNLGATRDMSISGKMSVQNGLFPH
jgi:hypothetical protein